MNAGQDQVAAMVEGLTWRRAAWVVMLPLLWLLLYYTLAGHVWLSLERWPDFGERLPGLALRWHHSLLWGTWKACFVLFLPAPLLFLGCLLFSPTRRFSIYPLMFCFGSLLVLWLTSWSATPFFNWFYD